MKKALHNTKSSVKLRKSEYRDEWYLYIESYPVFAPGKDKPQRVREYVNRVQQELTQRGIVLISPNVMSMESLCVNHP